MRYLHFIFRCVLTLIAVVVMGDLHASAEAQNELLCDLVRPPTVVVSVQGALDSCRPKRFLVEIFNASEAQRIEFTIPKKNVWPLTGYTLSVPENLPYALLEDASGENTRYSIEAATETFSRAYFALNWDLDSCFCTLPIGCEGDPFLVNVLGLAVLDTQG